MTRLEIMWSLIEGWILCNGIKIKEIISASEYTKLDKKLQDQYADLLKNQVPNKVEIYYHEKLLRYLYLCNLITSFMKKAV